MAGLRGCARRLAGREQGARSKGRMAASDAEVQTGKADAQTAIRSGQ